MSRSSYLRKTPAEDAARARTEAQQHKPRCHHHNDGGGGARPSPSRQHTHRETERINTTRSSLSTPTQTHSREKVHALSSLWLTHTNAKRAGLTVLRRQLIVHHERAHGLGAVGLGHGLGWRASFARSSLALGLLGLGLSSGAVSRSHLGRIGLRLRFLSPPAFSLSLLASRLLPLATKALSSRLMGHDHTKDKILDLPSRVGSNGLGTRAGHKRRRGGSVVQREGGEIGFARFGPPPYPCFLLYWQSTVLLLFRYAADG